MAKILIVEDSPDSSRMLAMTIARLGYEVDCAPDAQYAREYLTGESPDLMLLDISMPGISGLELLEQLRAQPGTAGLLVVIFSAVDSEDVRQQATALGAADFWVKGGFDFRTLGKRLETVFREHSAPLPPR